MEKREVVRRAVFKGIRRLLRGLGNCMVAERWEVWFYGGTGIDYGGRKCCWVLMEHLTLEHHVEN